MSSLGSVVSVVSVSSSGRGIAHIIGSLVGVRWVCRLIGFCRLVDHFWGVIKRVTAQEASKDGCGSKSRLEFVVVSYLPTSPFSGFIRRCKLAAAPSTSQSRVKIAPDRGGFVVFRMVLLSLAVVLTGVACVTITHQIPVRLIQRWQPVSVRFTLGGVLRISIPPAPLR